MTSPRSSESTRTPAIFVTHDQNEAMAIGDRVAVMRSGRMIQIDTPEQVYHRPVNRFVAAFMGEASFLSSNSGEITGIDGTAPDSLVMVRPDDVTFTASDDGQAEVVAAEFRGSSWCYTLRLASGSTVRSVRSHLDRTAIGQRVTPAMRPGHIPVVVTEE